jgi:uncharacterized protein YjiS (DUF1127 family)
MIDTRKTTAISHVMAGVGNAFSVLVTAARAASERRATRAALGRLDDHLLRDIGLQPRAPQPPAPTHRGLE